VLLSLNVPVAVNGLMVPIPMIELAGVTAIEINVALLTATEAVPVTDPEVALIVADPAPTAVATPEESTETLLFAEDDQATDVSNCVLPSSKVPTAVNCCVVPSAIEAVPGETAIEIRLAGTTYNVVVSLCPTTVAVRVVCPAPTVVTTPELSIVATEADEEDQVTPFTRSCDEPSL